MDLRNVWYLTTTLHGVTIQKTSTSPPWKPQISM